MTRKTAFFEGWSSFKFNNFGLTLGTNLKFYTSLSKGLKLKFRKFLGLILTFVEVIEEKLVRGAFCPFPILNRVKIRPFTWLPKDYIHVLTLLAMQWLAEFCICIFKYQHNSVWKKVPKSHNHCVKVSVFRVIVVRIFSYLDGIRRDTPCLFVFSPNAGKYGP